VPWRETCPMDERVQFIGEYMAGELSMAALCRAFEISRKTGYKWVARYEAGGVGALEDASRAPLAHPQAVSDDVIARIIAARKRFPYWGPRKLRTYLQGRESAVAWPVASTFGEVLKRAGLVKPRRLRRSTPPSEQPFAACNGANDLWCIDYKGDFLVGDGTRCYPLTITDAHTRYLVRCEGFDRIGGELAQPVVESAFREYGVPLRMRSDNGTPFACAGSIGLSRLAVWLIKVGVIPERITPGKPQQNGRHERMHRTLKQHTARPPQPTMAKQQFAFDRFRHEFNHLRPHEAIGQQTPGSQFSASPRPFPRKLPELAYPAGVDVRIVDNNGAFKWKGTRLFLSECLAHETIGVQETDDDGVWQLLFGPVKLAKLVAGPGAPSLLIPRRRSRRPSRERQDP
jgi:putative transposase